MESIPDTDFDTFIKDKSGLLKFHAVWCGPCRAVNTALTALAEETGVKVYSVDIDEHSDVAAKYGINAVPTVLAIRDGEIVAALVGSQPKEKYVELAEKSQPELGE